MIGARPERPYFVEQLSEIIPSLSARNRIKPGINGSAQVNYRYGASIEDDRQNSPMICTTAKTPVLFLI
jgi:lipopolysaccharide/colanic/teichoic acid biosynthesis glycosyltransferase